MSTAEVTTDATKRKSPERNEATDTAKPAVAAAAPAGENQNVSTDEAPAKRLKPTPPDPMAVRKQVEYYLSDDNLKHDKFFNEKIKGTEGGWLDICLVLTCNKMKAMLATKDDLIAALKSSKVEVNKECTAIRRPENAPLPAFEPRAHFYNKRNNAHIHDGGVIAAFKNVPEEQSWVQIKEALCQVLPPKVHVWFASSVSEQNMCIICASPFDEQISYFDKLVLKVGGADLKCEVCYGDLYQQALKLLPKNTRDRREKEARKRARERNRPVCIGTQRFANVSAVRSRVKEIINKKKDGEQIKTDNNDYIFIKELLAFHPTGLKKSEGMVGLMVDKSTQGDNRCFFMIKANGDVEDVSMKKCIEAMELDPPYAEPARAAPKVGEVSKPVDSAEADTKEAAKPADTTEAATPAETTEVAKPTEATIDTTEATKPASADTS